MGACAGETGARPQIAEPPNFRIGSKYLSDPHLEAWKQFRKVIGDDGTVGIWHETYLVRAGEHESIYGNMPRCGLANAFEHVAVSDGRNAARQRIGRATAPNGRPEAHLQY